jgi:phosphoadenosine phosphosulfate reductase
MYAETINLYYKRFQAFRELPLGTKRNCRRSHEKGRQIETLYTRQVSLEDNRFVLYSLYNSRSLRRGITSSRLTRLLDHTVESVGIRPTQIFGFDRDDMERFPERAVGEIPLIHQRNVTHDLDKITPREIKHPQTA